MNALLTFQSKAFCAYGEDCAEWIIILARACDTHGFVKPVAALIGYSHSAVSAVINASYTGKLDHIQKAVELCLMNADMMCPVLGKIPAAKCHKFQNRKKLRAVYPIDIALWRACHGACPNKRGGQ